MQQIATSLQNHQAKAGYMADKSTLDEVLSISRRYLPKCDRLIYRFDDDSIYIFAIDSHYED